MTQVLPALHSYDLLGFIMGTTPAPLQTVDGAAKPDYKQWFRLDQMILG
jgi:hypothetical protein